MDIRKNQEIDRNCLTNRRRELEFHEGRLIPCGSRAAVSSQAGTHLCQPHGHRRHAGSYVRASTGKTPGRLTMEAQACSAQGAIPLIHPWWAPTTVRHHLPRRNFIAVANPIKAGDGYRYRGSPMR